MAIIEHCFSATLKIHARLELQWPDDQHDQSILLYPPAQIEQEVLRVLNSFGQPHTDPVRTGPTHIFNLGHGIHQLTPPEHVTALIEAVHSHSRAQRRG